MKTIILPLALQMMLALTSVSATAQAFDPAALMDPHAAQEVSSVEPATGGELAGPPVGETAQLTAVDAAAQSTQVENPYGLAALWAQGDWIAKGTLIIMLTMSAFTWYILITKVWEQQRLMAQARSARRLWDAESIAVGASRLKENSPYRAIAEEGVNALKHHDARLNGRVDLQEWVNLTVQRSVERINSHLQNGLAFLATVGSTAPFIGLFGTVWGIYHALVGIGVSGQASIDKVAGPVGEALIMTAIGLAVAVPAVLGYNWLVRRNKVAMEQLRYFAGDVEAYLIMGSRVAAYDSPAIAAPVSRAA